MRRAVAYVRSEPAPAQREAIEAWSRREQIAIADWQTDVVDGTTPIAERPGLLAALAAVREREAGILVAANAERFSHDELVVWLIERAALAAGATLRTADGSAWTRGALGLARAFDRVSHRARIRASLAERKARGARVGTLPYGFRLAADGVHLEPDTAEQGVIASVLAWSADGLSQRAIVARLAERGVVGRTGAPLRQTQVAKLLRR